MCNTFVYCNKFLSDTVTLICTVLILFGKKVFFKGCLSLKKPSYKYFLNREFMADSVI